MDNNLNPEEIIITEWIKIEDQEPDFDDYNQVLIAYKSIDQVVLVQSFLFEHVKPYISHWSKVPKHPLKI